MPTSPPFEHAYIPAAGVMLHVLIAGPPDGPAVVLLHGAPENAQSWQQQLVALAAAGCFVIAPDQRGVNLSDKPTDTHSYQQSELAADVVALMDNFGRQRFAVVGHDWGGQTAWWLAASYPERVSHLVILNSPHPKAFSAALRDPNSDQRHRSRYMVWLQAQPLAEWLLAFNRFWLLETGLKRSSFYYTFDAAHIQRLKRAWSQPGALRGMLGVYRAAFKHRQPFPAAGNLSPTLIIWGMQDRFFDPDLAAASAERCASAHLHTLSDATHWLHHEHPARISALISEFVLAMPTKTGDNAATKGF
jgi:epoxide hydrolase 4